MKSPKEKYMNDPEYHHLVNMLEGLIDADHFTPPELREACVLASINYEMRRRRGQQIDPRLNDAPERIKKDVKTNLVHRAMFDQVLQERDALKQALATTQKNLDDTFGNMLEAQEERDDLRAQHKDCLEQKEALRERAETLELGYRGFP